uniref:(California timema) hypothetical protein n=1 Tax=Timema californicum TaxID=61474 RepID=A0A7R9P356_TIMCA|nr:unnamed protein product [Timema californicum]
MFVQAKKAKQAEIDRKRAEVRKRLEEASKAKKAKKGFMTPERKKKLRLLLRKKAAEELKKEQERKAAERRRIIDDRCGKPKNVDDANEETVKRVLKDYYSRINQLEDEKFDLEYAVKKKDYEVERNKKKAVTRSIVTAYHKRIGNLEAEKFDLEYEVAKKDMEVRGSFLTDTLKSIVKQYFDRVLLCEGQKWDLEHEVKKKDFEIADLNSQVNDLRGKFQKPTLKKVSKYENKFAKLQKKAAEFNFRNQLKVVKKKEFTLEEEDKEVTNSHYKKPDWSKGKDDKKVKEEEVEA